MDRAEQNEALDNLNELVKLVPIIGKFRDDIEAVILRNRFNSGQKKHKEGELGASQPSHEDMTGTPGPSQADPTGEGACWEELSDRTGTSINKLAASLRNARSNADLILDLSNIDVVRRAKREIPDCLACGDPCHGGVRNGFDDKCRKRWDRMGRPDRSEFVYMIKQEIKKAKSDE